MPSVNLFQIPQVINTTQAGGVGVNSATNKVDFDVSKNVHNEIEFLLKDIDRKAVSLTGKTLVIYIVNQADRSLKLQKTLQVINAPRGHCRLTLTPSDIADWDTGYLAYSITIMRADQTQVLVHQDQNRSQYGFLEVKQGPLPCPQKATTITTEEFAMDVVNGETKYITGAFVGAAQRDNRSGKHTLAIYSKAFTGKFKIQASLENGVPTSDLEWFDLPESDVTLTNKSGITNVEFQGSFMWVRFMYIPSEFNTGSITKSLFKN